LDFISAFALRSAFAISPWFGALSSDEEPPPSTQSSRRSAPTNASVPISGHLRHMLLKHKSMYMYLIYLIHVYIRIYIHIYIYTYIYIHVSTAALRLEFFEALLQRQRLDRREHNLLRALGCGARAQRLRLRLLHNVDEDRHVAATTSVSIRACVPAAVSVCTLLYC
jgi:hypothetical protein